MSSNSKPPKSTLEVSEEDLENYEEVVAWNDSGNPLADRWGTLTQLRRRYGREHPALPRLKALCEYAEIEIQLLTDFKTAIAVAGGDDAREFDGIVSALWRALANAKHLGTIRLWQDAAKFLGETGEVSLGIAEASLVAKMQSKLRTRLREVTQDVTESGGSWKVLTDRLRGEYGRLEALLPDGRPLVLLPAEAQFIDQVCDLEIEVRALLERASGRGWLEQAKLLETICEWVSPSAKEAVLANSVRASLTKWSDTEHIGKQLPAFGRLVVEQISPASPRSDADGWERANAALLLALTEQYGSAQRLAKAAKDFGDKAGKANFLTQAEEARVGYWRSPNVIVETLTPKLDKAWRDAAACLSPVHRALQDFVIRLQGLETLLPKGIPTGDRTAWTAWLEESEQRLSTLLKRCGVKNHDVEAKKALNVAATDIVAWAARAQLGTEVTSRLDATSSEWTETGWPELHAVLKRRHPSLAKSIATIRQSVATAQDWGALEAALLRTPVEYENAAAYLLAQSSNCVMQVGKALFREISSGTGQVVGWWLEIFGETSTDWLAFRSFCDVSRRVAEELGCQAFAQVENSNLGRLLVLRESLELAQLQPPVAERLARYGSRVDFDRLTEQRQTLQARIGARYAVALALRSIPLKGADTLFSAVPIPRETRVHLPDAWNDVVTTAIEFHDCCLRIAPIAKIGLKKAQVSLFLARETGHISAEEVETSTGLAATEIEQTARDFLRTCRVFPDSAFVVNAVSVRMTGLGMRLMLPTFLDEVPPRSRDEDFAATMMRRLTNAIETNTASSHLPEDALRLARDIGWFGSRVSAVLTERSRNDLRGASQLFAQGNAVVSELHSALQNEPDSAQKLARTLMNGWRFCNSAPGTTNRAALHSAVDAYLLAVVERAMVGISNQYGDIAADHLRRAVVRSVGREELATSISTLKALYQDDQGAKLVSLHLFF